MSALAFIWVLIAVFMVFIILVQKGKGGGLSGAFGGGAAGNVLGANTKKPMTWFTIFLACSFLFLAVILAMFYKPSVADTPKKGGPSARQSVNATAPAAVPAADTDTGVLPDMSLDNTGDVPSDPNL